MKVSDFTTVAMILKDRGTLKGALKEVEQFNPQSRHFLLAAGYFGDKTKSIEIGPLPSNAEISISLTRKIVDAAGVALIAEIRQLEQQLHELGVEVDQ